MGVVFRVPVLVNNSLMCTSGGSGSTAPPILSGPKRVERFVTMTTRGRQSAVRLDVGQRKQGVNTTKSVSSILDAKHLQSRRDPSWAGSNNLMNSPNPSDKFNRFKMRAGSFTGIFAQ